MPPREPNLETLLSTLEEFEPGAPLDKFIGEAVFPNFKNIAPGTKLTFDFPFTALVGANGTGKSSILHALWGMPFNYSTSRLWFSTDIDPISDGGNLGVPRYFYSHWLKELGRFVQTKKVRGRRRADYWEPARALLSDGMERMPPPDKHSDPFRSADRWNPTNREVKYINFKCEFSAFDRYFYYPFHTESRSDRQARFQRGAARLKAVISRGLMSYSPGGRNAVFENRQLTDDELWWVGYILGRTYVRARYVLHELYGRVESPSVFFEREGASYSEAFAGSGELSVVRVVMEVLSAERLTLVLLDEPETSLHPGAQMRLLSFLLKMLVEKHIQVVISTHSPTLINQLPNKAVKVLEEGPDGRSRVVSVSHPQVAFNRIGFVGEKILVAVEDALLLSLVKIAISNLDPGERDAIELYVPPGGADAILTYNIPVWVSERRNSFVILDGDKHPACALPDPDGLTSRELSRGADFINEILGVRPMHMSAADPSFIVKYITWIRARVFYLDSVCPELVLLKSIAPNLVAPHMTNQAAKAALIAELEHRQLPTGAVALSVAARWQIPNTDPDIRHLRSILDNILRMGRQ